MIITITLLILFVLSVILLFSLNKKCIYGFENIAVASLLPLLSVATLVALFESDADALHFAKILPEIFAIISVALFAVLFFLMAISNIVLIKKEGMSVRNTAGTALQFIFIFSTVCVYFIAKALSGVDYGSDGANRFCEFIPIFLYSVIDYAECVTLGIMIMGAKAVYHKPEYDKDFVIIPGCTIRKNGGLLPLLRGRVNRGIKFAWEQEISTGKKVCFVPSGGQGKDEIMSEGSAMALYLLSHAAEENEVFAEKASRNTYENFLMSEEIINRQKVDAKIAFATTNYHVLRCGLIARKIGMKAEGIASKTKWYFWPNGFAREVVAIFAMRKKMHYFNLCVLFALSVVLVVM